jgi:hypothetical protein
LNKETFWLEKSWLAFHLHKNGELAERRQTASEHWQTKRRREKRETVGRGNILTMHPAAKTLGASQKTYIITAHSSMKERSNLRNIYSPRIY